MVSLRILKRSTRSWARLGVLSTPHGEVETPAFVAVATLAAVKTLSSSEAAAAGCQLLIANTFHLHLRPGEQVVRAARGLHRFMAWPRPLMTDSGGFQVFSLGFGRDLKVGKRLPRFSRLTQRSTLVRHSDQPQQVKITDEGVRFRSPHDGRELFLGPRESMRIQQALGADITFAFDECTPPLASERYVAGSLQRTHRWAAECLRWHRGSQALYGIVQGSRFRRLREQSASFVASLDFDGYGIGGDLGESASQTADVLHWVVPRLDPAKPRHLLGIGKLEDMETIVRGGVDTFDCTVPTHYARHGVAFTSAGQLDLNRSVFLADRAPLDRRCACETCGSYTRSYLCHLVRANELTGLKLLTAHNLAFFNARVAALREKIRRGTL